MKRITTLISLCFIIYLLSFVPVLAKGKMTVVVLDLTPKNVPRIVATAVSDIIRSEFVNMGNFIIVERDQMNAILKEQGLQMTGCTDSSCAVKVGKILSARRIVVGEINKIGRKFLITARYVDVTSGSSLFSASDKAESIDSIDKITRRLSRNLAERIIAGDKEVIIPRTVGGYYLRSIVPGWGQFYAGSSTRGFLYSGLFTMAGLFTTGTGAYYFTAKNAYDNIGPGDSAASIKNKRDAYKKSTILVNVSLGLLVSVYAAHWVDVLFFTRPTLDRQLAAVERSPVYVTCNLGSTSLNIPEMGLTLGVGIKF